MFSNDAIEPIKGTPDSAAFDLYSTRIFWLHLQVLELSICVLVFRFLVAISQKIMHVQALL